jgi:membrane-associated phospholipid phosphatase
LRRRHDNVRLLLPAYGRRAWLVLLACCTLLTVAGGAACAVGTYGDPIDGPIDAWLTSHLGGYSDVLQPATDLGQGMPVAAMTAVLVLACLVGRRVNGAVLAAVSVPAAGLLTELVLKPAVPEAYSAYPSGRTTGVFAVITVLAVLLANPPGASLPPLARRAILAIAVLVGCVVAVATAAMNYHHFTDTIGGGALGAAVVLATTFLLDLPRVAQMLAVGRQPSPGLSAQPWQHRP